MTALAHKPINDFARFCAQPHGAVVACLDHTGQPWVRAIRYPRGKWKVIGYVGLRTDEQAWNTMEGADGADLVQLFVDETLSTTPPQQAAAIVSGDQPRAQRIRTRTADLKPGWYITTGNFGDETEPLILDGPLPQFSTALQRRSNIQQRALTSSAAGTASWSGSTLFIDCVDPLPAAEPSAARRTLRSMSSRRSAERSHAADDCDEAPATKSTVTPNVKGTNA
ncbi:hypothetical protein [Mycobacteroides chelonae]|nr:hypothetical protein [Mycobacteroides chelonae]